MANGALCLIRLLSLLKVLESPVRQPVGGVIRDCLDFGELADSVLISLDEFCEAVGRLQDFDHPAFFEQSVAGMALLAAGAGELADVRISEQAVGVWSTLTRPVNEQSRASPTSRSLSAVLSGRMSVLWCRGNAIPWRSFGALINWLWPGTR